MKPCPCGSSEEYTWILYDARGIPCGRVCAKCVEEKKKKFRPEIFTDSSYYTDEPIDED